MNKSGFVLSLLGVFLFVGWPGAAQSDDVAEKGGKALKNDEIKAEPFRDARAVGSLAKDDPVEIVGKEGGWLRIESAGGNGWVRMLSIRRGGSKKPKYTVDGLLGLASGREGTGNIVATTGIRGLNEEDLVAARFNGEQLSLLESYGVSPVQARQFAAEGGLKARALAYLPAEGSR